MTRDLAGKRPEPLGRTITRLRETLAVPESGPHHRGRWQTPRQFLRAAGENPSTPRETLARAHPLHWLAGEEQWLGMLEDRNRTSHLHSDWAAQAICERTRACCREFRRTHRLLAQKST